MSTWKAGTGPLDTYIKGHQSKLSKEQEGLIEATKKIARWRMMSDTVQISFLQNLVQLIQAKKTLDIGVFTGYSAMSIAMVLPPGGKVVACDISEEYAAIGKPFWKSAGVEDKIDLRIKPANETLQELIDSGETGQYDYAYIDADKPGYDDYYEKCLVLVRSGGIVVLDNMIWQGRVVDPNDDSEDTKAIRKMNDKVVQDQRVRSNLLTLGDGIVIAFKK